MTLTPEQRSAVSQWVATGNSLAEIQRKLSDELQISMTYMDVRFLVDDLGLELKSAPPPAPPKPAAEPKAETAPKKGLFGKLKDAVTGSASDAEDAPIEEALDEELLPEDPAPGLGSVKVEVDRLTRPGTLVSGTVAFSDGVSAKWAMDQYGRLMLDAADKTYKPSQADVQAFQAELSMQLQRMGY